MLRRIEWRAAPSRRWAWLATAALLGLYVLWLVCVARAWQEVNAMGLVSSAASARTVTMTTAYVVIVLLWSMGLALWIEQHQLEDWSRVMAELGVEPMARCVGAQTVGPFVVNSSTGDSVYSVRFDPVTGEGNCSCPAWRYSRKEPATCKHIEAVDATERCAWAAHLGGGQQTERVCPVCGGPTEYMLVAT